MTLYHGSPIGNLTELKPFLSEHGEPYVYLSSNPVIALLYATKPVPKPFSFYPYGFSENRVVYNEYYKNCFSDIYKEKKGFLYECEHPDYIENNTDIKYTFTSVTPLKVSNCTVIDDLYDKLMEYKKDGLLVIKAFEEISKQELNFVYNDIKNTIIKHNLKEHPDSKMSKFIISHFT